MYLMTLDFTLVINVPLEIGVKLDLCLKNVKELAIYLAILFLLTMIAKKINKIYIYGSTNI